MLLQKQEGCRQRGGEGHPKSPTVPSQPRLLAPVTADHTEQPAGGRRAVPDSQKRGRGNTWRGPLGPAKDRDGR